MAALTLVWVAFPLLLAAISFGCGSLIEGLGRRPLATALVLPTGFALVVVVEGLATTTGATARLAPLAIAVLAAAGLVVRGRRRLRVSLPAAIAAAGVFAAAAAPVVLSGAATFAGYIKLDDTATFLGMVDRVSTSGRSLAGLPPSTYEEALRINLAGGYPTGSFAPLALGHVFLGQDVAWLYEPYMAFVLALLALSLYALLGSLVQGEWLRACVVFLAAQPALLYGYMLWGGIKEVVSAALVALIAAHSRGVLERETTATDALGIACACAALVGALSVGGAVWLAPLVLAVLLRVAVGGLRRVYVVGALAATVLAGPSLGAAAQFLRPANVTSFTSADVMGNLAHRLQLVQVLGIWPAGDFRLDPSRPTLTWALLAIVLAAVVVGFAFAIERRAFGVVLYGATAVAVVAFFALRGSPWIEAKGMASAAPAFVLLAAGAAAVLVERRRRLAGAVLLAVIAGGVGWSNALAYRAVSLAPRGRLAELETIGKRFAGDGPALMTEYEPYGVRHFLRDLAPESASELRTRADPLVNGTLLPKGAAADIDAFQLSGILAYRTLVLRRSPAASRPPSMFTLVWQGRYYDVWERSGAGSDVRAHVGLGSGLQPAAVPACTVVRSLAAQAGKGGTVLAVPRQPSTIVSLATSVRPGSWPAGQAPGSVWPTSGGALSTTFTVAHTGSYEVSIGGSFVDPLVLRVDGREVSATQPQLNWPDEQTTLGRVELTAGTHTLELDLQRSWWRPGEAGPAPSALGPVVVGEATPANGMIAVPASRAAAVLCGRSLDWLEALAGS
jgi:hypothetical protein